MPTLLVPNAMQHLSILEFLEFVKKRTDFSACRHWHLKTVLVRKLYLSAAFAHCLTENWFVNRRPVQTRNQLIWWPLLPQAPKPYSENEKICACARMPGKL